MSEISFDGQRVSQLAQQAGLNGDAAARLADAAPVLEKVANLDPSDRVNRLRRYEGVANLVSDVRGFDATQYAAFVAQLDPTVAGDPSLGEELAGIIGIGIEKFADYLVRAEQPANLEEFVERIRAVDPRNFASASLMEGNPPTIDVALRGVAAPDGMAGMIATAYQALAANPNMADQPSPNIVIGDFGPIPAHWVELQTSTIRQRLQQCNDNGVGALKLGELQGDMFSASTTDAGTVELTMTRAPQGALSRSTIRNTALYMVFSALAKEVDSKVAWRGNPIGVIEPNITLR